ncbi:MAG: hypothetical protein OXB89_03355, partial [Anaerolineaceae bacterium]|nr:hypothetical protein [Anaerolineaceae bacterium]
LSGQNFARIAPGEPRSLRRSRGEPRITHENTLFHADNLTLLRDRAYFPDDSGDMINVDGGQHLQRL